MNLLFAILMVTHTPHNLNHWNVSNVTTQEAVQYPFEGPVNRKISCAYTFDNGTPLTKLYDYNNCWYTASPMR